MIIFLGDWSVLSHGLCMRENDLWAETLCTSQRDEADTGWYIQTQAANVPW